MCRKAGWSLIWNVCNDMQADRCFRSQFSHGAYLDARVPAGACRPSTGNGGYVAKQLRKGGPARLFGVVGEEDAVVVVLPVLHVALHAAAGAGTVFGLGVVTCGHQQSRRQT